MAKNQWDKIGFNERANNPDCFGRNKDIVVTKDEEYYNMETVINEKTGAKENITTTKLEKLADRYKGLSEKDFKLEELIQTGAINDLTFAQLNSNQIDNVIENAERAFDSLDLNLDKNIEEK